MNVPKNAPLAPMKGVLLSRSNLTDFEPKPDCAKSKS